MKRKYVPNLKRQQAVGEGNYMRLLKLLPDLDYCDKREFQLVHDGHRALVRLQVEERFTYTTTVLVSHQYENVSEWLDAPRLVVRLYHDARIAEVICMRRRQLSGYIPTPTGRCTNRMKRHSSIPICTNGSATVWLTASYWKRCLPNDSAVAAE